jgi:hypothetical protein
MEKGEPEGTFFRMILPTSSFTEPKHVLPAINVRNSSAPTLTVYMSEERSSRPMSKSAADNTTENFFAGGFASTATGPVLHNLIPAPANPHRNRKPKIKAT